MSLPDLSFVQDARQVEVETIEGGKPLHEFSLDPHLSDDEEEIPLFGRSVDDAEETATRVQALRQYIEHARTAYRQRGLVYPFQIASGGDSLEVLPGYRGLARKTAELSSMTGIGRRIAKDFEEKAFRALHTLTGGSAFCVGAPRRNRQGPKLTIQEFRRRLNPWEAGSVLPNFSRSGDHGADGFLLLGRAWGGPILFYQAKNTNFDLRDFPEEIGRLSRILEDWFGKRYNQLRRVIPVLALNTVLTLELKEEIFLERGEGVGMHLLDAVDILCAEFTKPAHSLRETTCVVF